MPDIRTPGLRGRLPVKPPAERFAIQYLSQYLRAPLPAPAYPIDVTGGITEWGMLGNGPDKTCTTHPQGVGDCTFAGRQHNKMAKAVAGHETEKWETSNELVAEYLAYDHGKDAGANIANLLLARAAARQPAQAATYPSKLPRLLCLRRRALTPG